MKVHWRAKIAAKLVLARLPIGYSTWRRFSLFRLGEMDDPSYAISVFDHHVGRSGFRDLDGRVLVELGPGDSLATALIARARGAAHTYLVDVGPFAVTDMEPYRRLSEELQRRGFEPANMDAVDAIEAMLRACRATYLTRGLESLRTIPSASVDFIFSAAVLEHVRRSEFQATLVELRRILKPTGSMSHRIDLEDHLDHSLNNLRYPRSWWESDLVSGSGFYTNRLRHAEILTAFEEARFDTDGTTTESWSNLPIARRKMATEFRGRPESDLRIRAIDLLARPSGGAGGEDPTTAY